MKRGLLLFAHGARDPRWALPFEDVAQRIRAREPSVPVALAFLEFMAPGIVEAGEALVARGCETIEVVPLFLGAGGHVRKDLPELLDQLRAAHAGVAWVLRPAVGEADAVIEAMAGVALQRPIRPEVE
jgi:sirohydrochlorin cobaltochelatase